jgi:hypothetical protein
MGNITQRVVAINDFGLTERTRVNAATGKESVRFAVSIVGTPVIHNIDTRALGRGPATAIAEHLRARMLTIQAKASDATIKRREQAARVIDGTQKAQFADALKSAQARYSGGRMGPMPPNQSDRLFNDSGRFAKGLAVRNGNGNEWVVNVPASRLNPATLGGPPGRNGYAALQMVYAKLLELIPEFGDPAALMKTPSVAAAIVDGWQRVIMRNEDLRLKANRAQLDAVKNLLGLIF